MLGFRDFAVVALGPEGNVRAAVDGPVPAPIAFDRCERLVSPRIAALRISRISNRDRNVGRDFSEQKLGGEGLIFRLKEQPPEIGPDRGHAANRRDGSAARR